MKFYALNQGDAQNIYPEEVVLLYSIDGKRVATGVKSLNGLKKGVYIINDKKAVVK